MARSDHRPAGGRAERARELLSGFWELPAGFHLTEEDYYIAQLAWREGLSVSTILDRLQYKHDAQGITRVRRSLLKAMRWGVLEFHPPRHEQLEEQLRQRYPSLDSVYVEIDRTATLRRAAELILRDVEQFTQRAGPDAKFVCANAGGRTIAEVVSLLPHLAPLPPQVRERRLTFMSLKSAEEPNAFGHCSNYLCVRMSEIFSAEHFVVVDPVDQEQEEKQRKTYRQLLQEVDLVVSSAGGAHGFLKSWLGAGALPEQFVGDVAFHPLDAEGKRLEVGSATRHRLEHGLRRSPDWDTVLRLFSNKKLLLVLTGDKFEISRALFRVALPRRCVLDSQLAVELCRDTQS